MLFGNPPGFKPRREEAFVFESNDDEKLKSLAGFGHYFNTRIIMVTSLEMVGKGKAKDCCPSAS